MHRLIILIAARKALEKLPVRYRKLVQGRLDSLAENPRPPGCRKLHGQEAYRVRQGPYRILCEVDDACGLVIVSDIKARGAAYRRSGAS